MEIDSVSEFSLDAQDHFSRIQSKLDAVQLDLSIIKEGLKFKEVVECAIKSESLLSRIAMLSCLMDDENEVQPLKKIDLLATSKLKNIIGDSSNNEVLVKTKYYDEGQYLDSEMKNEEDKVEKRGCFPFLNRASSSIVPTILPNLSKKQSDDMLKSDSAPILPQVEKSHISLNLDEYFDSWKPPSSLCIWNLSSRPLSPPSSSSRRIEPSSW